MRVQMWYDEGVTGEVTPFLDIVCNILAYLTVL